MTDEALTSIIVNNAADAGARLSRIVPSDAGGGTKAIRASFGVLQVVAVPAGETGLSAPGGASEAEGPAKQVHRFLR